MSLYHSQPLVSLAAGNPARFAHVALQAAPSPSSPQYPRRPASPQGSSSLSMSIFARESDKYDCPPILPFCRTSYLGPGPAMNAASAKETIQYSDPTLRDPNAALDKYNHRMGPAMTIGVVLVVLLAVFAFGLLIILDKNFRARLRGWMPRSMRCGRRKEAGKTTSINNSDITRVNTVVDNLERGMKMPNTVPVSVRGMSSPLRRDTTEGKKEVESQPGHSVPVLTLHL